MPETVEYLHKLGIIKVESYGDNAVEVWYGSLDQISSLSRDTGATRVLVDARRLEKTPNTLDLFNFAANLPFTLRFAVVISDSKRESLEFMETVGRNRGKSIRIFQSYEQAIAWLSTTA